MSLPLSLAKRLHQLKRIYRHVYAKVLFQTVKVPENQINNENQSGNSAIKENTQHIHTKIYMFKRKPESDDISHFLKIPIYMFKVPSTCLKVNPKAMICPIFQKFLSLGLNLMLLKAM